MSITANADPLPVSDTGRFSVWLRPRDGEPTCVLRTDDRVAAMRAFAGHETAPGPAMDVYDADAGEVIAHAPAA